MKVKSTQSCLTLCDPMDCSLPGSSLHGCLGSKVKVAQSCPTLCDPMDYTVRGILQARILEWVAFPFSRGSSQPRDQIQVSHMAGGFFTSWATRETHGRRIDTCIPMAESLYCPPETITVLLLAMKVKVKSLSRVQLFVTP